MAVIDLYGPLLNKVLFPTVEGLRGRPTVPLLAYLEQTQWLPVEQLHDIQLGFFRRLIRHAHDHTDHYREVLAGLGMAPSDFQSLDDLRHLPVLDRTATVASFDRRTSNAPPFAAIKKSSSGTTGQPVHVQYNHESRHWRDAIRWRGYGWSGYRIGQRALHYWGFVPAALSTFKARMKTKLDRLYKRDLYVDCSPRSDEHLMQVVETIRTFKPEIILAYSQGMAALARFVNRRGLKSWDTIPILCGAERVWPHDRADMEQAFGPAVFETYGCREVMLIGSECDSHDGLHASMENMIVELLVQNPDRSWRTAQPGEVGQVAVTDLHNLACPMVRYLTGDAAVARAHTRCGCGRDLQRIGPIDGRVTEAMTDGAGNPVSGLTFSVLFSALAPHAKHFQAVQRVDRSVVLKLVPQAEKLPAAIEETIRKHAAKYLPGVAFSIDIVDDIPTTAAGKRKIIVIEKPGDAPAPG